MPAYKYEALDGNGKSSSGIVEAETAKAARSHLRGLQLVPLGLTPVAVGESAEKRSLFARQPSSSSSLSVWTRQLAGLVAAGLPLERALTALADEAEEQKQRDLIAPLARQINGGLDFGAPPGQLAGQFDE